MNYLQFGLKHSCGGIIEEETCFCLIRKIVPLARSQMVETILNPNDMRKAEVDLIRDRKKVSSQG